MSGRKVIARRMLEWTGLDLERGGRHEALDRILAQRTRARGHASIDDYAQSLSGPNDPEVLQLLEVLTVGHTWFFRDEEQIAEVSRILSDIGPGVARVWVAGCSTGEEAYTIALLAEKAGCAIDILATDVNADAIARARTARFGAWSIRLVPPGLRRFFTEGADGQFTLDPRVCSRVRFERHNLMSSAPRPDGFHLVSCRNVLIYFGRAEASATLERLAAALVPEGTLFVGAGEVVSEPPRGCRLVQLGSRFAIRRGTERPRDKVTSVSAPFAATTPLAPLVTTVDPSPVRAEQLVERALARIEAGAPEQAISICIEALADDPVCAEAHLVLGVAFHMNGDAAAAEDALRAALYLNPDCWVASFYLARSYERLGRPADATRAYKHVETSCGKKALPSSFATLQAWQDEISALVRKKLSRGAST